MTRHVLLELLLQCPQLAGLPAEVSAHTGRGRGGAGGGGGLQRWYREV